ncbi:energy transducer TonB [Neptunicella marina]|uniref:Protein TonB n=1 Tax=Neptunicella marina TaxID=2125989 RepID=A0A8J6IUP8_9ALTE|nr:energy transducer TonB [Neptunicella marina]MBC3766185.1 energy transducer TonB [Neptunicella marina]
MQANPTLSFNPNAIGKALGFTLIATLMTFALFWLMQYLIRFDGQMVEEPAKTVFIDPVFNREDSVPNVRKILPPPPKTVTPPKPQVIPEAEPDSGGGTPSYVPDYKVNTGSDLTLPTLIPGEGLATPIVRVEPNYPIDALRNGVSGYVTLRFDISESGTVQNIQITDAEPKRVFDREARRALAKWKYKPRVENGVALTQPNQKIMLTFDLQK